jgi:hypothetical protein
MPPPTQPKPQTATFPHPLHPHTTLHASVTALGTSYLIFLTTTSPATDGTNGDTSGVPVVAGPVSALGSFIYGIPDVSFFFP